MLAFILRVLAGDLIWFTLGGLASLTGYGFGWLITRKLPTWARVLIALLLAGLCVLAIHAGFEAFWAWWRRPLAPPMSNGLTT